MRVRLLGTAAGGGFPQWNCACRNCRAVRSGDRRTLPRTQACVALSGDDRRWFLVGASPDIRSQIESFPPLGVGDRVRGTALEGILLTSADLDQALGLFFLREGGPLCVHASGSVRPFALRGVVVGRGARALLRAGLARAADRNGAPEGWVRPAERSSLRGIPGPRQAAEVS